MLEAKYGLPREVQFCRKCVISNQRPSSVVEYRNTAEMAKPTIHFDEEGVCDACRVAESKQRIDWREREERLGELCRRYRDRGPYFDCIIPGSGGKDSVYAAHILKTKFGMRPLLVTWPAHRYTLWGGRNLDRWQSLSTHLLYTPRDDVHRLLTRLALENLFHPFQPFIIGQKALPAKFAAKLKIPLVFYGEDEAEYGNPRENTQSARREYAYYAQHPKDVYLSGVHVSELKERYGLTGADLEPYMPATPQEIDDANVDVRYLGYYLKWKPQECYYYAVEHGGFECAPERTPGTYSKYNSIDDKLDDLHYWTTFIKFGIGRATYDAAQEIRSGDITREEGVALVKRFDGEYPERFEREVFEYLSVDGFPEMTRERLFMLADRFKSPHLWENGYLRRHVWD